MHSQRVSSTCSLNLFLVSEVLFVCWSFILVQICARYGFVSFLHALLALGESCVVLYVYYDMEGFSICNIYNWREMDSEEGAQTWSAVFVCMHSNFQKPPFPHTYKNHVRHTIIVYTPLALIAMLGQIELRTHTHAHTWNPILDCSKERIEFSKHYSPGYTRLPLSL